ncbi:hypothetical protein [Streptomyces sp. cg40]|uniref:hypothetical protein n=1 Tax=Streptomyces sp. cg40 TaxID=3419764 RepID=UPI003D05F787
MNTFGAEAEADHEERVLDITLPRPRTRARAEQAEQLARRAAELHALLLDSDT